MTDNIHSPSTMKSSRRLLVALFLLNFIAAGHAQADEKPMLLHEMTWVEVEAYLNNENMVIIPLGSIEQHGPHLPEGADYLASLELSKLISVKTGVVVAPVLLAGYSRYHEGFPGTISISPETMVQVIFECVESLIKHGFKKFIFLNGHGGNNIVQQNLIHRIDHATGASAVAVGVGNTLWPAKERELYDWHAGKMETSLGLCLFPDLVQMDKAEQPTLSFPPEAEKLQSLSFRDPGLNHIWQNSYMFVPEETGKSGASRQITSNGVFSSVDPKEASEEYGQQFIDELVGNAVGLINAWKLAE